MNKENNILNEKVFPPAEGDEKKTEEVKDKDGNVKDQGEKAPEGKKEDKTKK